MSRILHRLGALVWGAAALCAVSWAFPAHAAPAEVRGVWLTTTANTHIAGPDQTAQTMERLAAIGLNTVYIEAWKNGYTQFPSETLQRVIGVDRRPELHKQDPGDADVPVPARDLLGETVTEAHRNGLLAIAWFEYGFMAAHKDTNNLLRDQYPHWLSRDQKGNAVAPNGFVWMNPLHPETRRFLMDLVLEAVDKYDLDGVQLDDRIVWPYFTMGYDDFTVAWYRNEHGGKAPPQDPKDPEWMRWRADKVNDYARQFVRELREKRPGLIVSLSPAPYPWCWENYLLEWPEWAAWTPGNSDKVWWDEFIPQCYRYNFPAFKKTWDEQVRNLADAGVPERAADMLAGVLTTGSEPKPVPWDDLRQSVDHVRATNGGGHVWWFSRGVLDEYPGEITAYYDVAANGRAANPKRADDWRPLPIVPVRTDEVDRQRDLRVWQVPLDAPAGNYRVIVHDADQGWFPVADVALTEAVRPDGSRVVQRPLYLPREIERAELIVDRRPDMAVPLVAGPPGG